jgi:predicted RNA binding protein YcfA (HicA-like mRNA interferase family)
VSRKKGSRNERRTIALLEKDGYYCVRAAGSFGLFDVVGIRSTDIVLVQVKTHRWPSPAEMQRLKVFECPQNCLRLVHRWHDRVQMPDVKELIAEKPKKPTWRKGSSAFGQPLDTFFSDEEHGNYQEPASRRKFSGGGEQ